MSGASFPQRNTINSHIVKGKDDEASIAFTFLLAKDDVKQCSSAVGNCLRRRKRELARRLHRVGVHSAQVVFGEQRLVLPVGFMGFGCFSLLGEEGSRR